MSQNVTDFGKKETKEKKKKQEKEKIKKKEIRLSYIRGEGEKNKSFRFRSKLHLPLWAKLSWGFAHPLTSEREIRFLFFQ